MVKKLYSLVYGILIHGINSQKKTRSRGKSIETILFHWTFVTYFIWQKLTWKYRLETFLIWTVIHQTVIHLETKIDFETSLLTWKLYN